MPLSHVPCCVRTVQLLSSTASGLRCPSCPPPCTMAHPQTPRVFQKHKRRVPVHSDELLDLLRFRFSTEQQACPIPFLVCAGPAVRVQVQAHTQAAPHTATLQPLFPAPLPHALPLAPCLAPDNLDGSVLTTVPGGIVLTTDIREHGAGCMFTEPLGSPGLFSRSPTSLTAALCHLPSTPSSQL